MNESKKFTRLEVATLAIILVCCSQRATAGNKAQVSLDGKGKVESSLTFIAGTTNTTSEAKMPSSGVGGTTTVDIPAAGVFITAPTGWPPSTPNIATKPSPTYCPATNFCTVTSQFYPGGYKATVRANVIAGTTADNADLDLKIPITPAACASYDADSDIVRFSDVSGELQLRGKGSAGTAIWLRALLYTGDPLTEGQSPSRDDLIANGILKGELVVAGPYFYPDDCPARVPLSGDMTRIYLLVDAVAKSEPYTMTCPNPVLFGCFETPQYPAPTLTGGCETDAQASVTYSIAAKDLPIGVPTQVTAIASAEGEPLSILALCTFTATRNALVFDGFYSPLNYQTPLLCEHPFKPSQIAKLGQTIPIKFKTLCGGTSVAGGSLPTYSITSCGDSSFLQTGVFTFVAGEWHGQFDTSQVGVVPNVYVIEVILQNGTSKKIAVKLK